MITRVTPSSRNRSHSTSRERVIVRCVVTSCRRLPDPGSGTLTQHTTSSLPMSRAAIRSMICSLFLVACSATAAPFASADHLAARGAARHLRIWISCSWQQGRAHSATPGARLQDGLYGPRSDDVDRRPDPDFQPGTGRLPATADWIEKEGE